MVKASAECFLRLANQLPHELGGEAWGRARRWGVSLPALLGVLGGVLDAASGKAKSSAAQTGRAGSTWASG